MRFAVVVTLALGLGMSVAVFSVVDRLLFRSLPYPRDAELVSVGLKAPIEPLEFVLSGDYIDYPHRTLPFSSVTTLTPRGDCDLTETNPLRLHCTAVEGNFLRTLEIRPVAGRDFSGADDTPGAPPVALASFGFFRTRLGGSLSTIQLEGHTVEVVGVLPQDFELPTLGEFDLLLPQQLDRTKRTMRVMRAFARLKPGLTATQAEQQMQPMLAEALTRVPPAFRKEVTMRVRPLRDRQVGDVRQAAWTLLGAVLAVLLIACANVANLMLARGAVREREMAVRAALGAGRSRLVRQVLGESLRLALAGGAAGLALAWALLKVFVALAPEGIPRLQQAQLDARAIGAGLVLALASGVLFGLVPALQPLRLESLHGGRTTGRRRAWLRPALLVAQTSIALLLVAGAGLLLRSLWNLQRTPLGIDAEQVTVTPVLLRAPFRQSIFDELEQRLRRAPGVRYFALSDSVPPGGQTHAMIFSLIRPEGREPMPQGTGGMVTWRRITPEYFAALGIPIRAGRPFSEDDRNSVEPLVILGESLARRLSIAPGHRLRLDGTDTWHTVVGVAADAHNSGISGPQSLEYYVCRRRLEPQLEPRQWVIVRGTVAPSQIVDELHALDPELPVTPERLETRVARLAARPRFNAWLLTVFAGCALALAAFGLYSVVAFLVAQRRREIGIRMALGATPSGVRAWVFSGVASWLGLGTAIGLAAAFMLSRGLSSLLYNVTPRDPLVFTAGTLVLLAAGLGAAWFPARRASRVEPQGALRAE